MTEAASSSHHQQQYRTSHTHNNINHSASATSSASSSAIIDQSSLYQSEPISPLLVDSDLLPLPVPSPRMESISLQSQRQGRQPFVGNTRQQEENPLFHDAESNHNSSSLATG